MWVATHNLWATSDDAPGLGLGERSFLKPSAASLRVKQCSGGRPENMWPRVWSTPTAISSVSLATTIQHHLAPRLVVDCGSMCKRCGTQREYLAHCGFYNTGHHLLHNIRGSLRAFRGGLLRQHDASHRGFLPHEHTWVDRHVPPGTDYADTATPVALHAHETTHDAPLWSCTRTRSTTYEATISMLTAKFTLASISRTTSAPCPCVMRATCAKRTLHRHGKHCVARPRSGGSCGSCCVAATSRAISRATHLICYGVICVVQHLMRPSSSHHVHSFSRSCHPWARTRTHLSTLHMYCTPWPLVSRTANLPAVPITFMPASTAICTAGIPTPPEAPCTRIHSPGRARHV